MFERFISGRVYLHIENKENAEIEQWTKCLNNQLAHDFFYLFIHFCGKSIFSIAIDKSEKNKMISLIRLELMDIDGSKDGSIISKFKVE